MAVDKDRLAAIEERLDRLEALVRKQAGPTGAPAGEDRNAMVLPAPTQRAARPLPRPSGAEAPPRMSSWSINKILGWGGATALVLAAAYLIRLAINNGWLTPGRQIAAAVVAGLALIWTGLKLRESDREYASLLPAGGIVILFLSIYGAHLFYELIGATTAGVAVIAVCLGSLALCSAFKSQLYAFFAVVGSYSAPFLLQADATSLTDLIVYFCAWSLLFCAYSIWVRSRHVYLLALYLALIGFDFLWRESGLGPWGGVLMFQLSQFVIFTGCAVVFALRHHAPMSRETALLHAPALVIFYVLQYTVLADNAPGLAPWIAVGSAAVLLGAYWIARRRLHQSLDGSKWLLAAYCALVLFHAGYLESVPDDMAPWIAPILVVLAAAWLALRHEKEFLAGPLGWVLAIIFVVNYFRVVAQYDIDSVPASELLLIIYALQLYAAYYFVHREPDLKAFALPVIYAGHIAAMAAPIHIFDDRFAVSLSWGVLALACLVLSLKVSDKTLGQSSLLIFAVSVGKVLLFDLDNATPLVRIGCLVVVGVTLYLGGWLYKRIDAMEAPQQAIRL